MESLLSARRSHDLRHTFARPRKNVAKLVRVSEDETLSARRSHDLRHTFLVKPLTNRLSPWTPMDPACPHGPCPMELN